MNAYGDQQYGPPPGYGRPPGYGPPPGYGTPYGAPYPPPWPMVAAAWPYGPGRPGLATAAGVLGFVTAGLTIVVSLGFLAAVLSGDDADAWAWLMLLGLPCAAALIAGAAELLRRRPAGILFGSAMASIVVLVAVLVVGALELPAEEFPSLVLFLGCALPLPVLTAVFARAGRVTGWVAAGGSPVA